MKKREAGSTTAPLFLVQSCKARPLFKMLWTKTVSDLEVLFYLFIFLGKEIFEWTSQTKPRSVPNSKILMP